MWCASKKYSIDSFAERGCGNSNFFFTFSEDLTIPHKFLYFPAFKGTSMHCFIRNARLWCHDSDETCRAICVAWRSTSIEWFFLSSSVAWFLVLCAIWSNSSFGRPPDDTGTRMAAMGIKVFPSQLAFFVSKVFWLLAVRPLFSCCEKGWKSCLFVP